MAEKSYLKNQIKLVSLNANDMFTDEEHDKYMEIVELSNEVGRVKKKERTPENIILKNNIIAKRIQASKELGELIKLHKGVPRRVRLKSVLYLEKDEELPNGVTWDKLKVSRCITEFESEISRAMGIATGDYTFDKIIIQWGKNKEDILSQLVMDGFFMDILIDDKIIQKKYRCLTASAAQLRRDKFQAISEDAWLKIKNLVECGLTWECINAHGGCNSNKYLAYIGILSSATDEWTDFDIDRAIVIPDWESDITAMMMYIKDDYSTEIGVRTVRVNQVDGGGMMLPCVSSKNFIIRGPYAKGLLIVFDFIRFCREHNVPAVIKDRWGLEHDLIKENIQILFTDSQLKMAKYYDSWEHYKHEFKKNGCHFGRTQYEEDYLPDKNMNYQMIQTLTDFTDDEIKCFTARTHKKLLEITKDKDAMLETLKANERSVAPDKIALYIYPELLRDGYSRQQLKDTKKRMLLDAKSGAVRMKNKRLFVSPDWYAACEYYFMHIENPVGLVPADHIVCRPFINEEKADVLRSPHLYREHCIRTIIHDPKIYSWFPTDAIVCSCHDMTGHILQMDWDGDQLNVVVDKMFIEIAERNLEKYETLPLFYDAGKAPAEMINNEALVHGLIRAHKTSNIGEISNMLTRLWNRDKPDQYAAALITRKNNAIIDAAKTGFVVDWIGNPELTKRINKATGGQHGRMPFFFQFSKNGRSDNSKNKQFAVPNGSTMNRICAAFDDIGNIKMNFSDIPPFDWEMLMKEPCHKTREDIVEEFVALSYLKKSIIINNSQDPQIDEDNKSKETIVDDKIRSIFIKKYGSLEYCYPFICKFLFAGENASKASHKQTFWRVFGEIALENLRKNLENYKVCNACGAKYPSWINKHDCDKDQYGFKTCVDCGTSFKRTNSRNRRCKECQDVFRKNQKILSRERTKERKKEKSKLYASYLWMDGERLRIASLLSSSKKT